MSHETDQAFLEDYRWMLATGESHDTAATRFGVSANTLQRRVERVRQRVRQAAVFDRDSGRIGSETNGPTETVERLNRAYPLADNAESRTA